MTSQCPYCGSPVRPGAAFCANCGHTLPTTQSLLAAALSPGVELHGRYVISRRLGGGGSGDVYLATDKSLFNRPVVVKRLKIADTDPNDRIEAERNFVREAEALAGLNNPHFPQILDFFIDGPSQYLVMEFVAGDDLSKIIEAAPGPLPEAEVIYYGLQIVDLLVYLHSRDRPIIHRDIKPANIIVNQAKQATLVDFGIARSKAKPSGPNAADPRDSAAWGTPGYAPPEQVAGETVPQSDIYALGATLHHLITKRDPRDYVGEPFPPAIKLNPRVSQPFSDLLARMLNDDAKKRPDAMQLQGLLQQIAVNARIALATDSLPPTGELPPTGPLPQTPVQGRPIPQPAAGAPVRLTLGGVQVDSVPKLVALADRYWEEARSKLYSGDFAKWLNSVGERQVAAQAEATMISTPDRDMGLEAFLHRADPMLAQPRLEMEPQLINAGALSGSNRKREQWRARNTGRGILTARVRGQAAWVQVQPAVITLRPGQTVTGTVEVRRPQVPGQQVSSIVADAGPAGQASIEVHATAALAQTNRGHPVLRFFALLLLLIVLGFVAFAIMDGAGGAPLTQKTPTSVVRRPTATALAPTVPVVSNPLPPAEDSWASIGNDPQRSYYNPVELGTPGGIAWQVQLEGSIGGVNQLLVTPNRLYALGSLIDTFDLNTHESRMKLESTGGAGTLQGDSLWLADGAMMHKITIGDGIGADSAFAIPDKAVGAPLLASGSVYQAAGSSIYVLSADDGSVQQTLQTMDNERLTQPALLDDGPVAVAESGVVYHWAGAGELLWRTPLTDSAGNTLTAASTVGVMNNTVYLLAEGPADAKQAVAVNADGTIGWVQPMPALTRAAPALANGEVYFTTSNSVVALDAATGEEKWEVDLSDVTSSRGAGLVLEPPSIAGRLIYVATSNGLVITIDRTSGTKSRQLTVTRSNRALVHNPVPASNLLFVVDGDANIYALGVTK